jgi:hypothetical protein
MRGLSSYLQQEGEVRPAPLSNGFPTPPQYRCPERDALLAFVVPHRIEEEREKTLGTCDPGRHSSDSFALGYS